MERNHICAVCVANKHCELQDHAQRLELTHFELAPLHPELPVDATHERFILDHNRCILCTRCVRVCDEVEGAHTWDIAGRGINARLVSDGGTPWGSSTTCTSCGKCVQVCPTGALSEKGRSVAEAKARRPYLPYLVARHRGRAMTESCRDRWTEERRGNEGQIGDDLVGRLFRLPHVVPGHRRAPVVVGRASRPGLRLPGRRQGVPRGRGRNPGRRGGELDRRPAQDPRGPGAQPRGRVPGRLRRYQQRARHAQPVRAPGRPGAGVPGERHAEPANTHHDVPALLAESLPVHAYVPVDVFVPGCPPSADRIFEVVVGLLDGHVPDSVPKARFG